jgi:hypothetical protein
MIGSGAGNPAAGAAGSSNYRGSAGANMGSANYRGSVGAGASTPNQSPVRDPAHSNRMMPNQNATNPPTNPAAGAAGTNQ